MASNDLFKRAKFFENIARTKKLKLIGSGISAATCYKFYKHWEDIGLIKSEKIGRENVIELTDKGKEYLKVVQELNKIRDF